MASGFEGKRGSFQKKQPMRVSAVQQGGQMAIGKSSSSPSLAVQLQPQPYTMPRIGDRLGMSFSKRYQTSTHFEVNEVRALSYSEFVPMEDGSVSPKTPHEQLMVRLKSRSARLEAENNKAFLDMYRNDMFSSSQNDTKLDELLKATSNRAAELQDKSAQLQSELHAAERRLERVNNLTVQHATDTDLQALNAFERSQKRIQEDKKEEELQNQRDEAQAHWAKIHRKLQSELVEMRDYQVLLHELRRLRLEKLQEAIVGVLDGRRLRSSIREMIRHGAQRILQRLEQAGVPLEDWLREVLVNSCHIEIRIEDKETQLLELRRQALGTVTTDVRTLSSQTKQERFDNLCAKTWENFRTQKDNVSGEEAADRRRTVTEARVSIAPGVLEGGASESGGAVSTKDNVRAELRAVEAEIVAMRRLLTDMRQNAASAICHRIREAEKNGGEQQYKAAQYWGMQTLTLFVSEDFGKAVMKELQKSAPHKQFID
mmetsp:Transcript_54142/g.128912  ORF Transcript_54142/g.128912 Transcript_54142/m.128912 type:complete len:486 (-) Transcript_54142:186-1643(-)